MSTPSIEDVIAAHTASLVGDLGAWVVKCYCGHDTRVKRYPGDAWYSHHVHLADAIRAHLAEHTDEAAGAVELSTEWGVRRTWGDIGSVIDCGYRRAEAVDVARNIDGILVHRELRVGPWLAALAGGASGAEGAGE